VSTLAEIRAAVDEYTTLQNDNSLTCKEFELRQANLLTNIMGSVPDLLAIAAAAEKVSDNIDPDKLKSMSAKRYLMRMEEALAKLGGG
jgi:hypothetical protein